MHANSPATQKILQLCLEYGFKLGEFAVILNHSGRFIGKLKLIGDKVFLADLSIIELRTNELEYYNRLDQMMVHEYLITRGILIKATLEDVSTYQLDKFL